MALKPLLVNKLPQAPPLKKLIGPSFIFLGFLISTFIPWIWPGIIASSAKLFGASIGISDTTNLTIIFLILIGIILSFGPILYKTVESFQKILVSIGVPTIFL